MKHTYAILCNDRDGVAETKAVMAGFAAYTCIGSAGTYEEGLELVLEKQPAVVFLDVNRDDPESDLTLQWINELYRFLDKVPSIIVTSKSADLALDALRYDVLDYLIAPFRTFEIRKALLRFEKGLPDAKPLEPAIVLPVVAEELVEEESVLTDPVSEIPAVQDNILPVAEKPLIICVKSYGDYRFIEAHDICYLQADNNSTDIHLANGEMITGFKTLKHFENVLSAPFVRIHNSYIVNIDHVSRIHTGNSVCYLKNSTTKLPFSKSYKENVDSILSSFASGNYIEI